MVMLCLQIIGAYSVVALVVYQCSFLVVRLDVLHPWVNYFLVSCMVVLALMPRGHTKLTLDLSSHLKFFL